MMSNQILQKRKRKNLFSGSESPNSADKIVKMGLAHVPEGEDFPVPDRYKTCRQTLRNPKLTKGEINDLIVQCYDLFPRLKERSTQGGGSLSGGEQQMLAIARGLMMDPELIMLDEPSLGLAPIVVEEIFELILKIRDMGKTVLLIEQNASCSFHCGQGLCFETRSIP